MGGWRREGAALLPLHASVFATTLSKCTLLGIMLLCLFLLLVLLLLPALVLLFVFIVMGNVMVVVRAAAVSTVLKAYEIFVILSRFNFGDVT